MAGLKNGGNLILEFKTSYSPPKSTSINLEFNTNFNPNGLRSVGIGNALTFGNHSIGLKQQFIKPASSNFSVFGSTKVEIDNLKIRPIGIDSTIQVGTPQYVSWRRFILPNGIDAPVVSTMVSRVRLLGGYNAPNAYNINLNWFNESYNPPNASNLNIDFGQLGYNNIFASLGVQSIFGTARIDQQRNVLPIGFVATRFGTAQPQTNKGGLQPYSWNSNTFGQLSLNNNARNYQLTGFVATLFGTAKIELFKRFLVVKSINDNVVSDKAFVGGGKRFLLPTGKDVLEFGKTVVVNTRAAQTVVAKGINDSGVSVPKVYPLIIFQKSFVATQFGNAIVQRNPSPLGFVNTRYGQAWVSLNPRYLNAKGFDSFTESYPKIFDPKQTIYQQLTPITGGIFGDVKLKNVNSQILVQGFDSLSMGQWLLTESNLRHITSRSDSLFTAFGEGTIFNKTPSISPKSIVGAMGQVYVDYAIRTIRVSGFAHYGFGRATLTKPPELSPKGGYFFEAGEHTISNRVRTLFVDSIEAKETSPPTVWHRVRQLFLAGGIDSLTFGKPKLEHGIRELLFKGSVLDGYGKPNVDFRVRYIDVESIVTITNSNHQVGGTQYLLPSGFDAARYGERIIPEAQNIYAKGIFSDFGLAKIWLYSQYLKPIGFDTENTFLHGRWGTQKLWNKRQYITMYYDSDSLLNPPKENSKWLNVINRNRTMLFYGSTATIYGRPSIANKAVAILPPGIDSAAVDKQRISHYRQVVKIESMEPPYISGWSNVSNDAKVVDAKQFNSAIFGNASLENTRKFYKIQGYENQVLGYPMVAFKIRELTFENRYSIAPVRIELPRVQLWIRYVEPVSIFKEAFGSIELFRYQGRLTTRWAHKEYTGEPIIRNVTPELRVWSMLSEEFGKPSIELLRRYVTKDGFVATLLPKPRIEFKTRNLQMQSIPALNISQKHVLERIGSQPYAKQWISLEHPDVGYYEDVSSTIGYGIPIPGKPHHGMVATDPEQVSKPTMNQMVIRQLHINDNNGDMAKIGNPMISANTVRINSGIGAFDAGEALVSLKNRRIVVEEFPNSEVFQPSPAALSPWTIYAVIEAPEQARRNHPDSGSPQLVRSESVVGYPTLTLRHRKVAQYGSNQSLFGVTSIMLYRRYIEVSGFNAFRFGFHSIPEWIRTVEQHTSRDVSLYGYPEVSRPKELVKLSISPRGINEPLINAPLIEFFHRKFQMNGIDSAKFGASVKEDADYYPQHLHVGFKKPVIPQGTDCAKYGKNLISYLHRQVSVEGFNTFVSTYTIEKFKERLKVTLVKKPQVITNQVIGVLGIENQNYSTPDIKLAVHYIRPDGNSDQFRKGAPQ